VGSERAQADAAALMAGLSEVERDPVVFAEELMEARVGAKAAWAALIEKIAIEAGGQRDALPLARVAWQSASRGRVDGFEVRGGEYLARMDDDQRKRCVKAMEQGAWAARPALAKWRSLEASSKLGITSFKAVADSLDAACLSDSAGYFSGPAEMLARAGEGRFAELLAAGDSLPNGRLVFGEKVATEHPRGTERKKISALFDRWLGSCAPMAEHALAQRRAHVARPPSKSKHLEMGRLAQKMVRRIQDQACANIGSAPYQTQSGFGSMQSMSTQDNLNCQGQSLSGEAMGQWASFAVAPRYTP
jgi:hypothetical protein